MTINEILECLNKVMDKERQESSIETKGHFVAVTKITKRFANIKECTIDINYVNLDTGVLTELLHVKETGRYLVGEEEKLIHKTTEKAVEGVFNLALNTQTMEDIIHGLLGDK